MKSQLALKSATQLLSLASQIRSVTSDLPADVEAVLDQLFTEARAAFRDGDVETGVSAVETASRVARNKLPEGELRERLLYGCERVEAVATEEKEVAAEYAAAMARHVNDVDGP